MQFTAIKLKDDIGSEIRTDIAALLQPETAVEVRRMLIERGVLVFKRLHLTDDQQLKLSAMMGTVRQEGDKGMMKITLDTRENPTADFLKASFQWHLDGTHEDTPIFASLLSARVLSEVGGQTGFANSHAAYDALPRAMKDRIANLRIIHSVEHSMLVGGVEPKPAYLNIWRRFPNKVHPLVWTKKSGRKSLVIGSHAKAVAGMEESEGAALIAELIAWTTQERFTYVHEWEAGDLLI
jgi:alpha-ketoglutarate-dependent taurine dioxygenase